MAVKGALAVGLGGTGNMGANLGHDGGTKGHVGDEVAVHDVDVQPVGSLGNLGRAFAAQGAEVGTQDGGSNDSWRGHGGWIKRR